MTYSTSEVAKKLGLSKDTLRYYEKEGLLPPVGRNQYGHRAYTDSDVEWIFLIRCLRDTDMQISKIKKYVNLLMSSESNSIFQRRDILLEHERLIKEKIMSYQNLLQLIEKKVEFYDKSLNSTCPETAKCIDYNEEWEHFRAILGGIKYE